MTQSIPDMVLRRPGAAPVRRQPEQAMLRTHDPRGGGRANGPFGTSPDGTVEGLDRNFFSPETIEQLELLFLEAGLSPT